LIGMAVASLLFALLAAQLAPHRRQRQLASELDGLGASVMLVNDTPAWLQGLPDGLLARLGRETFARVDNIDLVGVPIDERVLEKLAACNKVRVIDFSYSTITDEQLARLNGLRELRVLNLSNTRVTNRSIPWLIACDTLVDLDITATGITAEAVEKLQAALPHLDIDH